MLSAPARRLDLDEDHFLAINHFLPSGDLSLFNRPEFFQLHLQDRRGYYCQLVRGKDNLVLATAHFTEMREGHAQSPARGTYGGVSAAPELAFPLLESFLRALQSLLEVEAMREAVMALAPAAHGQALFSCLWNILTRLGWEVSRHELNYSLEVAGEPFAKRLSNGNYYKLKKCHREGLTARQLTTGEHHAAYDVISGGMIRKGYDMSMSFSQVKAMTDLFPAEASYWGAFQGDSLAGACITFQAAPNVYYLYAWGFAEDMGPFSPNLLLAETLFDHCLKSGMAVLDIGAGTLHGEPDWGLMLFKRRLGLGESLKLTFTKTFTE